MEQENRFEGIRTVHPNRLKPQGIVILCLIGVLLLGLALYHIPLPERVELVMRGGEVDAQGNEVAAGAIIVEGWRYRYLLQEDRLQLNHLELPNFKIGDPWDTGTAPAFYAVKYMPDDVRMTHAAIWTLPKEKFDFTTFWIFTTDEYDFFVFYSAESNRIFVGSPYGTPDYVQILDKCMLLEE